MATGKDLNHRFLEIIDKKREKCLADGKTESELSGNVVDVSGNNDFVNIDDLDKFKAINELKNYLEFSTFKPEETYEIPGTTIFHKNREERVTLYIKKEDIGKIAEQAEILEDLLYIQFPSQIYQFQTRYSGNKVPGTNIDIPRPKLMSETEEQYEEYLKGVYEPEGIEPEQIPDGVGRMPYPHEQIEFSVENVINDKYFSEYYLENQRTARLNQLFPNSGTGRPNNRIDDDDELVVRESDDLERTPLGQKIGAALTTFENTFKNASTWQKIRHAGVAGLILGAGCFFAYSNPIGVTAVAVAIGAGTLGGLALRKLTKMIKKKAKNWLYGSQIEDEEHEHTDEQQPTQQPQRQNAPTQTQQQQQQPVQPQQGSNNTGAPAPQPQPRPTPTPTPVAPPTTPIPEELDGYFNEAGLNIEQYREVERRISVAENELKSLVSGTPEHQAKLQEIATLKTQQKEELSVIENILEEMLNGLKNNNGQGRTL